MSLSRNYNFGENSYTHLMFINTLDEGTRLKWFEGKTT